MLNPASSPATGRAGLTGVTAPPPEGAIAEGAIAWVAFAEEEELALLPPSDEELCGLVPDPDCGAPDGDDAWLADLPADQLHEIFDAIEARKPPEVLRPGLWPRDTGDGAGFAAGGVADRLTPGPVLAGLTSDAWRAGLQALSDDELIGVMRAWHRLESWASAGKLAAVAELTARRAAAVEAGADPYLIEHVDDEIAVPLTLTNRAAGNLLDFATSLRRLPLTAAALAAGQIDRVKALIITDEVTNLDTAHAARWNGASCVTPPARRPENYGFRLAVLSSPPTRPLPANGGRRPSATRGWNAGRSLVEPAPWRVVTCHRRGYSLPTTMCQPSPVPSKPLESTARWTSCAPRRS